MSKVTKLELLNRLKHIEKLLKHKKSVRNDRIVKSWNMSSKQLKRYIDKVIDNDRNLSTLFRDKDVGKYTFVLPKTLKEDLEKFSKKKNTTQKTIMIRALYEFFKHNKD